MSNPTEINKSKVNLSFLDPVFLSNYGPLSSLNILEYFYLSPFYDSASCNEQSFFIAHARHLILQIFLSSQHNAHKPS